MSPIVSAMLETVAGQDTELRFLEELFAGEAKCEASHGPDIPHCSVSATHRVTTSCSGGWNICESAALAFPRLVAGMTNKLCPLCKASILGCWTVTPI